MTFPDLASIFQWWFTLFILGLIFLPLNSLIFSSFFDKGYIFSKIVGIALVSYVVFILGILKILPFDIATILIVLIGSLVVNFYLISKFPNILIFLKKNWQIFIIEEIIFLATIIFWAFIHSHQPDIHGLEKYMDFGFINSILRSDYFPSKDMWLTPFSINYYYFGHLVTAVLTKLSYLSSSITYNLMLATISGLTFAGAFSIGANLLKNFKFQISNFKLIIGGLLSGFIITFAGNLHSIYLFFKPYENESPVPFWQLLFSPASFPNSYWYPNATRFIHNTIHEFPLYSFVVSDLHGHVLDIPFVLLAISILLSLLLKSQITNHKSQINLNAQNLKKFKLSNWNLSFGRLRMVSLSNPFRAWNLEFRILLLAFLLAIMYMTNAWDGIIYFLLAAIVIFYIHFQSTKHLSPSILNTLCSILIIGSLFFIFTLPFNLNFKPFASGIGVLCAPEFLTNIGKIGPFLFEKDHCEHSPIWQLAILYGFFYFWAISFIIFIFKNRRATGDGRITISDIFILILIAISTLLIIIPEFIYVKDIYPAHYRANTMFKLVYQSFIMLSLANAYIFVRLILNIKNQISKMHMKYKIFNFYYVYLIFAILFFILVFLYPYFAINSYFENLKTSFGLDGTKYLNKLYPTDYKAIEWINKNIKGQPIILEADGNSYTDYGRVSTNTGLPTVLGWAVHEWLWRGSYDVPSPRISEIAKMYEEKNTEETKKLLDKYDVSLVFIGDLERQKYANLYEEKFSALGKIIYENGKTKIYKLN